MNKMPSHLTYWTLVVFILSTWTICRGQGSYWGNITCPKCPQAGIFCINPEGECVQCTSDQRNEPVCITQCPPGTYGDRCQQRCGHCREAEACNHSTGTCPSGCDRGYMGELCDLECDPGQWGYDCNDTCGHCLNTTCLRENGTCPWGCEGNFLMPLCEVIAEPRTCSCEGWKIAVYALSAAAAIVPVLFVVALCVFCNRHRRSKQHLRAIRQETKLNEVHRQLKETLVCHSYFQTDPSSGPRANCGISSFTRGQDGSHQDSRDNGACSRTPEVSEATSTTDQGTPDYQNLNCAGLRRTPRAAACGRSREELYLDMNGPKWPCPGGRGGGGRGGNGRRAGAGGRGAHASRPRAASDQEEIYINEF